MTPIQPQQFAVRPRAAFAVGTAAPAPQVQVTPYQATPAMQHNNGQGLAALGNVLGNFFGRTAQTIEDVGQTLHKEELREIGRENEALQQQAATDQMLGKAPNEAHMDRKAYASTFKSAAADSAAFDLSEGLKSHMATMPLDGSADPKTYAELYFREQVGNGSGDAEYDARMLYQFTKSAEGEVGRYRVAMQETQEAAGFQTIHQSVSRLLQHQQGITGGQMATAYADVLTAARGNTVVANKHFVSMLGNAIQNDGQALSVLNGLQASGWAEANPADYLKLSQDAHSQTNKIKTWQAGTDVQGWHNEYAQAMAAAKAQGRVMNLDEVHALYRKAQDIDSRHGVGQGVFGGLDQALVAASKQTAGTNLVVAAYRGLFGTHDGAMVAAHTGEEPAKLMTKYFDLAIPQIVQEDRAAFPNLSKSIGELGLVNPLAGTGAAREFATLLAQKTMQTAAPGGMSDTYKIMLGNALLGTDEKAQAIAFQFFKTYEDLAGPAVAQRVFNGPEAAMRFAAVRQMGNVLSPEAAFTRLNATPEDAKVFANDGSGNIDWSKATGKLNIKQHEFQAELVTSINKAMREHVGRDQWVRAPNLIMGSREENMMLGLAAMNMRDQHRVAGTVDTAAAVAEVAKQMRDRFVVLPGHGGSLQLLADPYGGRGRVMTDPVNTVNGKKVYAGFKVTNAFGDVEDPVATYRMDVRDFTKALPGLIHEADADKVALAPPDAISGLHQVIGANMMPLMVGPGQRIALPFEVDKTLTFHSGPTEEGDWKRSYKTTELREVTLPTDPKELNDFLVKHLPPGFHPVAGPRQGAGTAYHIQYGFRIEGDEAAANRRLQEGAERGDALNRRLTTIRERLPLSVSQPAVFYPKIGVRAAE